MCALVIGGTGHLGRALVLALRRAGHPVTAVARRPPADPLDAAVRWVTADATAAATLRGLLPGHRWVFHAAAPYPVDPLDRGAPERARAQSEALVEAAAARVERLVVTGSFVTGRPADPFERRHPYFASKAAFEAPLLAAGRSGLPVVVLRATAFIGPGDPKPPGLSLPALAVAGRVPLLPDCALNVVDVRDLAAGHLAAAAAGPRVDGRAFVVGGADTTLRAVVGRLCALAGVPPPRFLPLPLGPAALLGELVERVARGLRRRLPVDAPTLGLLLLRASRPVDSAEATAAFGYAPTAPAGVERALRDQLAWIRRGAA